MFLTEVFFFVPLQYAEALKEKQIVKPVHFYKFTNPRRTEIFRRERGHAG